MDMELVRDIQEKLVNAELIRDLRKKLIQSRYKICGPKLTWEELDYLDELLLIERGGKEPVRCQNCDEIMPDLCPVCEKAAEDV